MFMPEEALWSPVIKSEIDGVLLAATLVGWLAAGLLVKKDEA